MKPHEDTLKTQSTLLSKVRRGDEDGWSRFYDFYEDFIYSAARSAGLSHEESQDIVQETMISVRKYVSDFVPDENRARFRTWLRKIVQSRIADKFRQKNRNPLEKAVGSNTDDSVTSVVDRLPDLNVVELDQLIDGKFEQAIVGEAQRSVKERISMEHYQAYDLFHIQGLSAKDVATSLGISPVTVRVQAFRIRRAVEREVRRITKELPHLRR